jgi:phage terminase small subunit
MTTIAIHKTFTEEGESLYFVTTSTGTVEMNDAKLSKTLSKLPPSETTIRITNVSSSFKLVETLREQGFTVTSAHWHATGIAKNLEPAEIAAAFYALADDICTEVKLRADIFNLKQIIAARYSAVDYRRAATLKLLAIARTLGLSDDAETWPSYLEAARRECKEGEKELENPITKAINVLHERNPRL